MGKINLRKPFQPISQITNWQTGVRPRDDSQFDPRVVEAFLKVMAKKKNDT
jgi:response regulator RpfG family c-di-GMP phosphodiesterase